MLIQNAVLRESWTKKNLYRKVGPFYCNMKRLSHVQKTFPALKNSRLSVPVDTRS